MIPVGFGYGEQSMSDPFQPFVSRAPNGFAGGVGNPMQDAFQRLLSAQGQGAGGMPSMGVPPMDRQKQFGGGYSPEMQAYYDQDAANQIERTRRLQMLQGVQGAGQGESPMGVPPVGFAGGGTGMPPIGEPMDRPKQYGVSISSPYNTDPSRPQISDWGGPRTRTNPMSVPPIGQPMDRQEYDDRDDAAYQARRSEYEQFMATQGGQPLAGRLGPQQEDFTISDGKFFPRPQQEDFTISDGKFFPRPQQPQVAVNSGGYNPMTGVFTPSTTTPLMPPAGGTPPMTQPPMGGGLPYNNGFNNPGQPQQPMTQPAVGTPFNKPTGPQVQPPMAQPPAGGGTGTSPQPYNNGFYNPGQPPMAMKKGGFAVKAVWDKKRPKDLGKPKDLSAKKEKSAKARAKAAGRPYPNLIDNMAVARKKGK